MEAIIKKDLKVLFIDKFKETINNIPQKEVLNAWNHSPQKNWIDDRKNSMNNWSTKNWTPNNNQNWHNLKQNWTTENNIWSKRYENVWNTFYFENILPKMQNSFKIIDKSFQFWSESNFKIDGVFANNSENGWNIPQIYVESWNNNNTTEEEIFKLCCLNSPLKVFMTWSHDWNMERDNLAYNNWQNIVNAFSEKNMMNGELLIIIAEWRNNTIHFTHFAYTNNGKRTKEQTFNI